MDALLTINAGAQTADAIIPAKVPQKHEQQFGKVLNKKRQEHHRSEKPVAEKRSERVQHSEPKEVVSHQPSEDPQPQSVEPVETEAGVTAEAEEVVLGAGDAEEAEPVFDLAAGEVDAVAAAMEVAEDGVEPTLTDVAEIPECAVADADEEADKILEDGVAELSLQSVETAVVTPVVAEGTAVAAPERQQQVGMAPSPADVKPVQQQMTEAAVAVPNDDREIFSMSQVVASHVSDDVTTDEIVADEDIDLFALDFTDKAVLVVLPVIDDGFDAVGPASKVRFVKKLQYVVEVQQSNAGEFLVFFLFCHFNLLYKRIVFFLSQSRYFYIYFW